MTEAQWLAATDPRPMVEYLGARASDRKYRLFQVACCRRAWALLTEACRDAVVVAERYADGEVGDRKRQAARRAVAEIPHRGDLVEINARTAVLRANEKTVGGSSNFLGVAPARAHAARAAAGPDGTEAYRATYRAEREAEARLLRDLFGNPFRPVTPAPHWLTPAVRGLAGELYEQRSLPEGTLDPARLAILADALEDAGCADEAVLAHCREPGTHVRGCWLVDLLLGRW